MNALFSLLIGINFLASLMSVAAANELTASSLAVGELGARYHTGTKGKSFNGALGTFLYFQASSRHATICPHLGTGLEFITGQATLSSGDASGTAYTGGFYPGLDIFLYRKANVEPFIEAHGIATWTYAKLSPVVPKTSETSLGMAFGFQVGGGIHIDYNHGQRAVRLHFHYSNSSGKLAGQSGFQFNAFGGSLGLAF